MKRRVQGNRRRSESDHEDDLACSDAGASLTIPTQSSSLRKGGYVMLKNRPCKIVEISTSNPGKHGHSKVHVIGLDIFSGKKCEDISPSSHNMDVPVVNKADYQLVNVTDNRLVLLDGKGQTRSDLPVPDGKLGETIFEATGDPDRTLKVTVIRAMGHEMAISCRNERRK